MIDQLEHEGYVMVANVFSTHEVEDIRSKCDRVLTSAGESVLSNQGPAYGARNLLALWPELPEIVRNSRLNSLVQDVLGPQAGIVRSLYFDKPPGHSWALPWHRDWTIAVKKHHESNRYRKPTVKAGVPHVEAPVTLLSKMLTLRIHLDAMTMENGPLRVAPGSHAEGLPSGRSETVLNCQAGDVLLMRPLLLHASGHTEPHAGHRRIVHLECAPTNHLDEGWEWQHFCPIAK